MPLTHSMEQVALAIHSILEQNKATLGLKRVILGATDVVPEYPAVVVMNSGQDRSIKAIHKFSVQMQYDLFVLVCKIGAPEDKEEKVLELLQSIVDTLAIDRTLGGRVIWSQASTLAIEDVTARSVTYRGGSVRFIVTSEEIF